MEFDFGPWESILAPQREKAYFAPLTERVGEAYAAAERGGPAVYPPKEKLFRALHMTPPERVKCVIVGQDPYHEAGQACGLSFSVAPGVKPPRSLCNIYKELHADLGCPIPAHGCLDHWAEEGVLLLNHVLTVYDGQAGSHGKFGWQHLTDSVLAGAAALPQPVAFILWGRQAQEKTALIDPADPDRLAVQSAPPSPLSASRGFFGSRPFSRVNAFLEARGTSPIDWALA